MSQRLLAAASSRFSARQAKATVVVVAMILSSVSAQAAQNLAFMTNKDVLDLKSAGVSDDIILLKIRNGPTKFSMETADIVALKSVGITDAVIAEMLKSPSAGMSSVAQPSTVRDLSKGAIIFPFESSVKDPAASGLPDATRTAVMAIFKLDRTFAPVGGPEEAKDKKALFEITAELIDFAGGNVATRMIIGLGSGRAHAGFTFTVKESATGKVVWKKTIKETASFWSNSASSSAQRLELPEKVAKTFVEELKRAKIPGLP